MEPHDENQTNQDIGFENNIDHLRKEHYKSINNVEKVIKSNNSMGEMNESKNIEHVINEHDKQLADARDALNSIADMQRKFAELIPVEELVANNNNNNNNNNENGNNLYNDVGDDIYFDIRDPSSLIIAAFFISLFCNVSSLLISIS